MGRSEVNQPSVQPSVLGEATAGLLAQATTPFRLTLPAERAPSARKRVLALTAGLLLVAAIGVPLSTTARPLTALSSLGQESPAATEGVPEGDLLTYRQAEAGAYAGVLIPSPEGVAQQAQAEGGYQGRNLFPPNSHQRHGH